ncbi:MAG: hypothetical protein EPN88_00305, partial [Bacteroidetes bacterium]
MTIITQYARMNYLMNRIVLLILALLGPVVKPIRAASDDDTVKLLISDLAREKSDGALTWPTNWSVIVFVLLLIALIIFVIARKRKTKESNKLHTELQSSPVTANEPGI